MPRYLVNVDRITFDDSFLIEADSEDDAREQLLEMILMEYPKEPDYYTVASIKELPNPERI